MAPEMTAVRNATSTGLPKGFDVRWSGTDDTTPDGYFLVIGLDAVGNRTDLLYRGDKEHPADADLRGRIVWTETGNTVYRWWNAFAGANIPAAQAVTRIIGQVAADLGLTATRTETKD